MSGTSDRGQRPWVFVAAANGVVYIGPDDRNIYALALPRGFAHDRDPLITARAELREELGVKQAELRLLGHITPDSGILASKVAVVAATFSHAVTSQPDDLREFAAVRWFPRTELYEIAAKGELEDGMTLAALTLAQAVGLLETAAQASNKEEQHIAATARDAGTRVRRTTNDSDRK